MPPHQESRWSFYRCFVLCWGGGHACPPAVTHAAVIILLFEEYLAWHVVFPLQAREIGTKASIMVCKAGSLLLWMYMSWFSLSWIALFDHCRVAFDSALCFFFHVLSSQLCAIMQKTQNTKYQNNSHCSWGAKCLLITVQPVLSAYINSILSLFEVYLILHLSQSTRCLANKIK